MHKVDLRVWFPETVFPAMGLLQAFVELQEALNRGHTDYINKIEVHEGVVYSVAKDETLRQWDPYTGGLLATANLSHSAESMRIFGTRLFLGYFDAVIREFDLTTGECVQFYKGHKDVVTDLLLSEDGEYLYSASADSTVIMYSCSDGKRVRTFAAHSDCVSCIVFSPDRSHLFTASFDHDIGEWPLNTQQDLPKPSFAFKGHSDAVTCLLVHNRSNRLYSAGYDSMVIWWNLETKEMMGQLKGHAGGINCMIMAKKNLYTASDDTTIRQWNLQTRKCVRTFTTAHTKGVVTMLMHGGLLYTAAKDNLIHKWDPNADNFSVMTKPVLSFVSAAILNIIVPLTEIFGLCGSFLGMSVSSAFRWGNSAGALAVTLPILNFTFVAGHTTLALKLYFLCGCAVLMVVLVSSGVYEQVADTEDELLRRAKKVPKSLKGKRMLLRLLIYALSMPVFVPVSQAFFGHFSCFGQGTLLRWDLVPDVQCFSGWHLFECFVVLVCYGIYVPWACRLAAVRGDIEQLRVHKIGFCARNTAVFKFPWFPPSSQIVPVGFLTIASDLAAGKNYMIGQITKIFLAFSRMLPQYGLIGTFMFLALIKTIFTFCIPLFKSGTMNAVHSGTFAGVFSMGGFALYIFLMRDQGTLASPVPDLWFNLMIGSMPLTAILWSVLFYFCFWKRRKVKKEVTRISSVAHFDDNETGPLNAVNLGGEKHFSVDRNEKVFDELEMKTKTAFVYQSSKFKDNMLKICQSTVFSGFFLLVILFQCALMVVEHPDDEGKWYQSVGLNSSFAFLYTIEFAFKLVAWGAWNKHTKTGYFQSGWNWLDVLLLGVTYLDVFLGAFQFAALRALRLLRPLRAINRIPQLRILIYTIMHLEGIVEVLILLMFLTLFFAVYGLEMYKELLQYRCVPVAQAATYNTSNADDLALCASGSRANAIGASICKAGFVCKGSFPNPSVLNFDTIGTAMITTFSNLTLEAWSRNLQNLAQVAGKTTIIWFVLAVVTLGFLSTNLIVAVISRQFNKQVKNEEQNIATKLETEAKFRKRALHKKWRESRRIVHLKGKRMKVLLSKSQGEITQAVTKLQNQIQTDGQKLEEMRKDAARERAELVAESIERVRNDLLAVPAEWNQSREEKAAISEAEYKAAKVMVTRAKSKVKNYYMAIEERGVCSHKLIWLHTSCGFRHLSTLMICLNVLALAYDYPGMGQVEIDILKYSNYGFVGFFTFELLLGITAYGPWLFFQDLANFVDFLVVSLSLVELFLGGGALSIIRMFRLLRILFLLKGFPALRILVISLVRPLVYAVFLVILMTIFIFITASLATGMYYKKAVLLPFGRFNFSSLYYSSLTMFQVITSDGWLDISINLGNVTGSQYHSAFIFTVYVIGYIVVISLVTSIILQQFLGGGVDVRDFDQFTETCNHVRRVGIHYLESGLVEWCRGVLVRDRLQARVELEERVLNLARLDLSSPQIQEKTVFGHKDGGLRGFLIRIVGCSPFQIFIVLLIITSSVTLTLEHPNMDPDLANLLSTFDIVFAAIFCAEMLMKFVGYGFVRYWINFFNVIDGFVSIISVVCIFFPNLSALRALRAFRPFVLLSKSPDIRLLFISLFRTGRRIIPLLLISILVLFAFSVLGVKLFQSRFYLCTDLSINSKIACTGTFLATTNHGNVTLNRVWKNELLNFDHVGRGMVSVFQVATMRGWTDVMYRAMHTPDKPDFGPVSYNKPHVAFVFIGIVIVGGFFLLNLFNAVVIDSFVKIQSELDGSALMSTNERKWRSIAEEVINHSKDFDIGRNKKGLQLKMIKFVTSRWFELTSFILIQLSIISVCFGHAGQEQWVEDKLKIANLTFVGIFTIEAVLKIFAFRKQYFKVPSITFFEFLVVVAALILTVLRLAGVDVPFSPSILRMPLAITSLRHIPLFHPVYTLFLCLLKSLKLAFYAAAMVICTMFVFAIVGVELFGKVKVIDNRYALPVNQASYLFDPFKWSTTGYSPSPFTDLSNFRTFPEAFLAVFQVVTLDNWVEVLEGASLEPPFCTAEVDCGSFGSAGLFFLLLIVSTRFIMVSLFMAIILDFVNKAAESKMSAKALSALLKFKQQWKKYDPGCSGFISVTEFMHLLHTADAPYRWDKNIEDIWFKSYEENGDPKTLKDIDQNNVLDFALSTPKYVQQFLYYRHINVYKVDRSQLSVEEEQEARKLKRYKALKKQRDKLLAQAQLAKLELELQAGRKQLDKRQLEDEVNDTERTQENGNGKRTNSSSGSGDVEGVVSAEKADPPAAPAPPPKAPKPITKPSSKYKEGEIDDQDETELVPLKEKGKEGSTDFDDLGSLDRKDSKEKLLSAKDEPDRSQDAENAESGASDQKLKPVKVKVDYNDEERKPKIPEKVQDVEYHRNSENAEWCVHYAETIVNLHKALLALPPEHSHGPRPGRFEAWPMFVWFVTQFVVSSHRKKRGVTTEMIQERWEQAKQDKIKEHFKED